MSFVQKVAAVVIVLFGAAMAIYNGNAARYQILLFPGGSASSWLISWEMQPWLFYFGVLTAAVVSAALLYLIRRFIDSRWRRLRDVFAFFAFVFLTVFLIGSSLVIVDEIAAWNEKPLKYDPIFANGYTVAQYKREMNGKTCELVFFGEQHIADLDYYISLNRDIGDLTQKGFRFFKEESKAFAARPHVASKIDTDFYYERYRRRMRLDVLRQPDVWPAANASAWSDMDPLPNDPAIQALGSIKDDAEWAAAVHEARNVHLLNAINRCDNERLAVVFGYSHFAALQTRLTASGWVETTPLSIRPAGRPLPTFDEPN